MLTPAHPSWNNVQTWKHLLTTLFPLNRPTQARWDHTPDIRQVLAHIASQPNICTLFMAQGGSMDLLGAIAAPEPGLINLDLGSPYYALVRSLTFESFHDPHTFEADYFRLELEPLAPQATNTPPGALGEQVVELAPNSYQEYHGGPVAPGTRTVVRLLGGTLLIFQKLSFFTHATHTHSGRYNQLSEQQLRGIISRAVQQRAAAPSPGGSVI